MREHSHTILLLFFTLTLSSAIAQNQRLEIPVRLGIDEMYMAPIGQQVVVFNKNRQSVGHGQVEYTFRKYGLNFHQDWTIKAVVKRNLPFIDYTFSSNTLYLLFGKSQTRNYQVLKVNVNAGFIEKIDLFFLERLKIYHLAATQNDLYVGGILQGEPSILHINLILKKTKIMSINFKGRAIVESLYLDTLNNFVNATVVSSHYGETKVLLKSYFKGKEVRSITLPNDKKRSLQDAQVIATENDEQLVVAPYSRYKEMKAHQGLFVARLTPQNKLRAQRFYSFNNFKNFYKHLGEKEQKRIERKILRRKKKGKRDYPVQSKILLHKIVKQKNQYLIAGEMYLETIRVPGGAFFTPRSFPRQPLTREWEYNQVIGMSFDKNGNLQWDNVMKLNRVKVPQLYPVSMINVGVDSSHFVYYYNDNLYSKTFSENYSESEVQSNELKTLNQEDNVRENLAVQVCRWYHSFYLIWGYQRIKNKRTGKRKVFFVQKMSFASK